MTKLILTVLKWRMWAL